MAESNASAQQQTRSDHPTGWLMLTRNQSIPYIIDALLDAPPEREFNQSELGREAGVSRQSVAQHLDLLLAIGVLTPVADTSPQRYRFQPDSPVSEAIIKLDGAMNAIDTDAR